MPTVVKKQTTFRRKASRKGVKKGKKAMVKKTVSRMLASRGLGKGMVQVKHELHEVSGYLSSSLSGSGDSLVPTAQGVDADNYDNSTGTVVGLKYVAKYINFRGVVFNSDSGASHRCRIIIAEDMQPTGTPLELYSGTSNYQDLLFMTGDIDSLLSIYSPRRFKILYDKFIVLSPNGQFASMKKFSHHINLHNALVSNTLNVGSTNAFAPQNRTYTLWMLADSTTNIQCNAHYDFAYTNP